MKAKAAAVVVVFLFASFVPSAFALTQVAEKRLIDQPQDEIEPALIGYTSFGVEYNCSVWMNFDPNINAASTLRYTAWTVGGSGLTGTGTIPAVSGYSRYADPVLVKHPTLNRIFLVGLVRNDVQVEGGFDTDTAVVVWYSNNGGWNWSSPTIVASDRRTQTTTDSFEHTLDKPVAATGPDGRLWVSYIRRTLNTVNTLQVQNGTASGSPLTWSWSARTTITSSNAPATPQIAVDSDNDVYVLATRSTGIGMWRDDAQDANGVSFAAAASVPSVGTMYRTSPASNLQVATGVTIRAVTVPIAKLDRTRRRLSLVWHEANPGGGTRLQFAVFRLDGGGWTNTTFAAGGGVNHVNIGMDYDTSGSMLVTWYRFSGGSSTYTNVGKYVTFDPVTHNPSWVSDDAITGRLGDAANLTPDSTGMRHIGEYHEVSFTNGKFKAVHLIAVAPWADPWAFTVSMP